MEEFRLIGVENTTTGLSHHGRRLALRPTPHDFAYSALLIAFAGALTTIGLSIGGVGRVLLIAALGLFLLGCLTANMAVTADTEHLTVRNRFARRRVEIRDVDAARTDLRHFRWGKAPYSNLSAGPKDLLVGVVILRDGKRLQCDAVTSLPAGHSMLNYVMNLTPRSGEPAVQPSAVVKMAALERWITTVRANSNTQIE